MAHFFEDQAFSRRTLARFNRYVTHFLNEENNAEGQNPGLAAVAEHFGNPGGVRAFIMTPQKERTV